MTKVISFEGLGNMGLPMATNLLEAGYTLKVYNRTAQKAQPLIAKGTKLGDNPGDVVEEGGIAIAMLPNDQALEDVVKCLLECHLGQVEWLLGYIAQSFPDSVNPDRV